MNTLGQRIAHYRKSSALTQEELAEKCGVTAQAVSKWENDVNAPDISLLPLPAPARVFVCGGYKKMSTRSVRQSRAEQSDQGRKATQKEWSPVR